MIAWVREHRHRIQEIGLGLFLWESFNFGYDMVFYPFALAFWGIVKGGIIVASISLIINAFVFWLYEYLRVDWLGAHALRELDDEENKSNFTKLAVWLGKKKVTLRDKLLSPIVFIGLLLPIDPVIVAVHYRRSHFKGIAGRDWGILLLATLVANLWWMLKVGLIVEAAKYLYFLLLHFV